MNGAIQESTIVYINNGLNYTNKNNIKILEIGFGTGLNCLLTIINNLENEHDRSISYTCLEPFPIEADIVGQLNYPKIINSQFANQIFEQIHAYASCENLLIQPNFSLTKSLTTIQQYQALPANFDLIYFDAFGPTIQPEMWTKSIFDKMYETLKPEGILVTYCAKGEVKRQLKAAGFKVEGLPGPPGKREVTRAIK